MRLSFVEFSVHWQENNGTVECSEALYSPQSKQLYLKRSV